MNIHTEKKHNIILQQFSVFLFYIFIVCMVYILPAFKFVAPYMIAAAMMLATIVPFFLKKCPWTVYVVAMCSVFLMLTTISIITGTASSPVDAVNTILIRNVRFFLPIFWSCYAFEYTTKKQQTIFLTLFSVIVIFVLIKTLIALETDPWIARVLAQGKESTGSSINRYRLDNVGGFEYSYMMGIIAFCLTWSALKTKNILLKVVSVTAVVLVFYYIIETMYTTLLLLTFAGVFILLFLNIKSPFVRGLLVVIAVTAFFFLAPILGYLSTAFPKDSLLNVKFQNFYYALTQGNVGKVGSRPDKIVHSVEQWLRSPLFGLYNPTSNAHSLVFSTLETGGIVGFIPWFATFFVGYDILKKVCIKKGVDTQLLLVSFMYVIALSVFNPIGYVFEVTIAAFFIAPLCCSLLE